MPGRPETASSAWGGGESKAERVIIDRLRQAGPIQFPLFPAWAQSRNRGSLAEVRGGGTVSCCVLPPRLQKREAQQASPALMQKAEGEGLVSYPQEFVILLREATLHE